MTITQTVEIPANRRITLEVPCEVPAGRAQVEIKVIPFVKNEEKPTPPETMLLSEASLSKEWNTQEEDEAWASL